MSKKKINYHEHEEPQNYPNIANVASATETTGLMPTPAQNADEYRSYQDVGSMAVPKKAPGKPNNRRMRLKKDAENHLPPLL